VDLQAAFKTISVAVAAMEPSALAMIVVGQSANGAQRYNFQGYIDSNLFYFRDEPVPWIPWSFETEGN
jgi:hypothetical protein